MLPSVLLLVLLAALQPALPEVEVSALPAEAAASVGPAYDAARLTPLDHERVGQLGVVLHAWEQWDPARAAYDRARALAPQDPRWGYLAGLLEIARGRHADAVPLLAHVAALDAASAIVRLRLAEAQLAIGELDACAPHFAALATVSETAPAAAYGLGRVAAAHGRHADAVRHFDRALAIYPDFGAAHYARALSLRALGDTAGARDAIARQQACLACWPATPDPLAARVRDVRLDTGARLQRATARARDGDVDGAIADHLALLERSPDLAQAHVNLVALFGQRERWAEAEAHYRRALEGGANAAEAHAGYGEVLLVQRRFDQAATAFQQALAVTPQFGAARNGLGLAHEARGEGTAALAAYRQAVADAPTLRSARFNLARLLVTGGALTEAIAELERVQDPVDGETPRYRFALAAALVRNGQVERGRQLGQEALTLALRFRQDTLAATIARDLARLPSR